MHQNEEIIVETLRIFANITRETDMNMQSFNDQQCDVILRLVPRILEILLDHSNDQAQMYTCGIMINVGKKQKASETVNIFLAGGSLLK